MLIIDWFQANMLMTFTALVLLGIPTVIMLIVFSKKKTDKTEV